MSIEEAFNKVGIHKTFASFQESKRRRIHALEEEFRHTPPWKEKTRDALSKKIKEINLEQYSGFK